MGVEGRFVLSLTLKTSFQISQQKEYTVGTEMHSCQEIVVLPHDFLSFYNELNFMLLNYESSGSNCPASEAHFHKS